MSKEETLRKILEEPFPLSDEQRRAVLAKQPYLRIVAGAGAGKTETLTRRIAYLLLCEQEEPASIVAFTFTERAAQSMKTRVYERMKDSEIYPHLGEMYIGTIHGYCFRLLEDYFGYGDHDVLDENQEMAFLMRHGWGLGLRGGRYSKNCGDFLRSVNVVYDEVIDRKKLAQEDSRFLYYLEKYEGLLAQNRFLTFGLLMATAVNELESKPEVLAKIRHLIVDEYQDINRAQERLIHLIGRNASVFIVGDPRQCIYQWRGSDEKCFDEFLEHFKDSARETLRENRRSVKAVVDVANLFANTFERAKYEPLKAVRSPQGVVTLLECEAPASEADWVVKQIQHLVKEDNACTFSDTAILLRSVKTSAGPFIDVFRNRNFPYIVGGKIGLFRRDEAQAVGRLFAWLSHDGFWLEDPYYWRGKIQGDRLLDTAMELWRKVCPTTPGPASLLRNNLKSWKSQVLEGQFKNFTEVYHGLLVILGFRGLDPSDSLQATVMANLGRFSSLLADYESSIRLGGRQPDWPPALKGLCWFMNTYATGAYEEQPVEDLRGINAIQIMTVHQAKGLEWPVVFIPCLTSKRFPSSMTGRPQRWYVPRELFEVERYEGSIEDERRLFYVAMTRARDVLSLSRFRRITNRMSPSRFLKPFKAEVKEIAENEDLPIVALKPRQGEQEIQSFSAAEIITYRRCPFLYQLREIWGYKPGLVTPLGYGKSLHDCLRHAAEQIQRGAKPKQAVLEAIKDRFHLPYAGGSVRERIMEKAKRTLVKFVERHEQDMISIEEVESRLEFPMEKATITGRVDVIMRQTDEPSLEVRDYKTSEEVTTLEESRLQVSLYALGLRSMSRPVTLTSVAHLEKGQVTTFPIDDRTLDAARTEAAKCIRGITTAQFDPKPGHRCPNCDYRRICSTEFPSSSVPKN